jgi:hypothetical protein
MRTALCWTVSCLQARFRLWIGHIAIGLAVAVSVVPAAFAQDPRVLGHGKSAGAGLEAEERQTHDEMSDGLGSQAREPTGVFVDVPIGRVWVDPEFLDGEPVYVRRITESMAIVEVSTTPFMPVLGSNEAIGRPEEQPASW